MHSHSNQMWSAYVFVARTSMSKESQRDEQTSQKKKNRWSRNEQICVWKEKLVLFRPYKYQHATETGSALGYVWTCACVLVPELPMAHVEYRVGCNKQNETFVAVAAQRFDLVRCELFRCMVLHSLSVRSLVSFIRSSTAFYCSADNWCENSLCSPVDSVCANRKYL